MKKVSGNVRKVLSVMAKQWLNTHSDLVDQLGEAAAVDAILSLMEKGLLKGHIKYLNKEQTEWLFDIRPTEALYAAFN